MFQAGKPVYVPNKGKSFALDGMQIKKKSETGLDEAWLQNLIDRHPECLPIGELEPGFTEPVAICRELPTDHGPIDNFLMTPEGDMILVETKLWRNSQARREVVAQALDYASCLFEMDYSDLEKAVKKGQFREGKAPESIYSIFEGIEEKTEENFIDAVNKNLRRGRIMVLVVGDGIRTETERLTSLLQSHAGFHFTFALVELQIFHLPKESGFMVVPRTLARTFNIERGVVRIEDKKIVIDAIEQKKEISKTTARKSITSEQFFEAMEELGPDIPEKLKIFLDKLDGIGVRPDFLRTLNLKWDPPEGKPVNCLYIERGGFMWTEAASWFAPKDIARVYITDLADKLRLDVSEKSNDGCWVSNDGKGPRITDEIERLDIWFECIERFINNLKNYLANEG